MSTPNFQTQKNFNLYLWDYTRPSDDELDENILANEYRGITSKEEITEDIREQYILLDIDIEYSDVIRNFKWTLKHLLEKYNRTLNYFNIELKDGYYSGLQFYVDEDCSILKYSDFEDITNEDTQYYYNEPLSIFKRKYQSEINFINKKLLPKLAQELCFEQYYCYGIFSNGEAVYCKVEENPRAKLIQAIREVA